jgi:hypothetical protein
MDELESLEQQLRSMPQAAAPEGLLERLLADIPASNELARRRSPTWNLPWAAVAAVLCVMAALAVVRPFHPSRTSDRERAVTAQYVVYRPIRKQETDPCCILPPLPKS